MSTVLLREIKSYEVIVQRSAESPIRRVLRLDLKPIRGNPVKTAEISFEPDPKSLGDLSDSTPLLRLPLDDFDNAYHLLQTEKPVYFSWGFDEGGEKLAWCDLSTTEEPIGEGFTDMSDL